MSVKIFENERWKVDKQQLDFRHKKALEMIDEGRVLDMGCGDGLFLELLKKRGIDGLGLDISDEAVSKCRARGQNAELTNLENPVLSFLNNEFKFVVMLDVLEHLYYPQALLLEASRVAENVIFSVPNFNSLPARLQVLFGQIPENKTPRKGHIYWFNYLILQKMIKDSRLEILQIETNTIWENKKVIGLITKFLSKIWPNIFALSFVVCCKKMNNPSNY